MTAAGEPCSFTLPSSSPYRLTCLSLLQHPLRPRTTSRPAGPAADAARRDAIDFPYNATSIATAGVTTECSRFVLYDTTCGGTLYTAECNMCSTDGMDAYVQRANAMSANSTSVNLKQAFETLQNESPSCTLSIKHPFQPTIFYFDSSAALERLCQSCTRTALRTLGLTVETATSDALALLRLPSFCFSVAVVLVGSLILLLSTSPSPPPLLLPLTDNAPSPAPPPSVLYHLSAHCKQSHVKLLLPHLQPTLDSSERKSSNRQRKEGRGGSGSLQDCLASFRSKVLLGLHLRQTPLDRVSAEKRPGRYDELFGSEFELGSARALLVRVGRGDVRGE